jgi:hypothetical protein
LRCCASSRRAPGARTKWRSTFDGQPIAARLPPKEIIQSIRISTNPFASEFAQPSAGLVEIFTKPANSRFRGEYQGTFNDSSLNARNAFEPRKTPSRTQSLAGYLGGPLVRSRWSFLAYGGLGNARTALWSTRAWSIRQR